MKVTLRLLFVLVLFLFMNTNTDAREISFAGLTWQVRDDGKGSPGGNFWRDENVWVDNFGRLHLQIRKVENTWTCAELQTIERFLFGKFSFEIIGRIDEFDKNIVFGLFKYPQEKNRDGFDEIDIEFSKWGKDENGIGNYTVYSDVNGFAEDNYNFQFALEGTHSTHSFTQSANNIIFQSFHGHRNENKSGGEIRELRFFGSNIAKKPMPIYLNFWLFRGVPPSNSKEAEIVINDLEIERF